MQASQVTTAARQLTAAQRRYLRACESLARVRHLSPPSAVQVNIAERQGDGSARQ
jgi:hypothetical protein